MVNRKLTKSELVSLVRKIMDVDGTEEELDDMETLLEQNVPHPEVSDLIFCAEEELTPEEIVEKALAYKPLVTPPPNND
ncbi:MAG: bacteriocin immunity protein [Pseudomonadales bacterium]|nr:bacteriocin immunity protein [Pseudomonadales bacterium]